MSENALRCRIAGYSEHFSYDVEAAVEDEQHAIEKARRYTTQEFIEGLPAVVITDIFVSVSAGERLIGTWELWTSRTLKAGLYWHPAEWLGRPDTSSKSALRALALQGI